MFDKALEPIDYLAIGHITRDYTQQEYQLGGSVSYAALTAQSLGLRAGIITSWAEDLPREPLNGLQIINIPSDLSTTFQNQENIEGRVQFVTNVAADIKNEHIPEIWRNTPIIHLGPVAQEVDPLILNNVSASLIGVTPQGWYRKWDQFGYVSIGEWSDAGSVLKNAGAAVISMEDILGDELFIEELSTVCPILAITEGSEGVQVYWNGDVRRFNPPSVELVDPTGAGDIFAAVFFARLYSTRDPWEAARLATILSANSITRTGLSGVPSSSEINAAMIEVI